MAWPAIATNEEAPLGVKSVEGPMAAATSIVNPKNALIANYLDFLVRQQALDFEGAAWNHSCLYFG